MVTRRALLFASIALAAASAACGSDPPSLVVGVSTQMRVPKDLGSVRIVVDVGGTKTCESFAASSPDALPQKVVVTGAAGQTARVTAAGFAGPLASLPSDACSLDGALVVRSATTTFEDDVSLFLPLPLRKLCENVACDAGSTCFAGACDSDAVDSSTLVRYDDSLLFGDTSFCISQAPCLDHRSPVFLSDPATCTFSFAIDDVAFDNQGVNLELVHDDFEREVVDIEDLREGFTVDPAHPKQFVLAPRLCEAVKSGKITVISAGVGCAAKTALNPMCDAAHAGDNGRPKEGPTTCTSPTDVAPSPRAFDFLLDRSSSMGAFYIQSSGTLSEVLDLTLAAPSLRTAAVGLHFMPIDGAACTSDPNPAAMLAIPFGPASTSHDAIAGALRPSQLLPNDPPLFLDAALRSNGAYAALEALDPAAFVERELVVVGNHDFGGECDPTLGKTSDLSFSARVDRDVDTGAILLPSLPTTDQRGRDPYVDAVAMARAGFGIFADGSVGGDSAAALAVLGAFDAKQACTYDLPPGADTSDLASTYLTWFDVVAQNRVDVPFDAACVEAISAANGFNVVGNRVLVCGGPCAAIKTVLDTSGLYAIGHHIVPPLVPVRWSPRCAPR